MPKEFNQAEREIPAVFFENYLFETGICFTAGLLLAIGQFLNQDSLPAHLSALSAATYITGRVMDRYSTIKALDLIREADELRVSQPYIEANPLLPDTLTSKEYMRHPQRNLEFMGSAISAIFPPFGFMAGLKGGIDALSNSRKSRRLIRAIEIARS